MLVVVRGKVLFQAITNTRFQINLSIK
jgi:hypothetical protein